MKRAIIFGSTGFIGAYLLEALLHSPDYSEVVAVTRKPPGKTHPKLTALLGDFHTLPTLKHEIHGDELFITLGTTRKDTPDLDEYYRIDHDYPVLAARIAKDNGVKSVFLVTAVGADAASRLFYVRTKGEVERDILQLEFDHTHIFRPSMLMGARKQDRPLEKTLMSVWSFLDPLLIGKADRYRGISGKDVAAAMINAARGPSAKLTIYHWREMIQLPRPVSQ